MHDPDSYADSSNPEEFEEREPMTYIAEEKDILCTYKDLRDCENEGCDNWKFISNCVKYIMEEK